MYNVVISPTANTDLVIFRIEEEAQEVRIVHFFHATQDYLSTLKNEI